MSLQGRWNLRENRIICESLRTIIEDVVYHAIKVAGGGGGQESWGFSQLLLGSVENDSFVMF